MDTDDCDIMQAVSAGHNVVIQGAAGTGKSTLICKLVNALRSQGKSVMVTAMTGIAALNLAPVGAFTLHSSLAIGDGKLPVECLTERVPPERRASIRATEVLVIDEMSMMSKHLLTKIDILLRHIKCKNLALGGMQTILVGDFYQLPPVPDLSAGDSGEHCHQHPGFTTMFPHIFHLRTVRRYASIELQKAVQETAEGMVSKETVKFLESLRRPLPSSITVYATSYEARIHNIRELMNLPGENHLYKAEDELLGDGRIDYVSNKLEDRAPKILNLKVGAPVIITRNLYEIGPFVVNGQRGIITACLPHAVRVAITGMAKEVEIVPILFEELRPADWKWFTSMTNFHVHQDSCNSDI